ncbi:hypothetical protein [Sphingopyxis sp.]|uniref:hypothetical protein n=1 Tax=Sphingopyxis sp. TaxID=1908224 RepID=UPI003D1302EC
MSAETVAGYAEIVALRVERLTKQQLEIDQFGTWLGSVIPGLNALQFNAMNQGHHIQFSNAITILQMIDAAIPTLPPREPKVNWEDLKDQKSLLPRDLSARLRSMDARLSELEPRSKDIAKKISDIENAHSAADQLPTDLAELAEKRVELSELITSAQELAEQVKKDSEIVGDAKIRFEKDIKLTEDKISKTSEHAESILAKSEHALRGATAVGLAKAFEARKQSLSKAGMWWTIGLAVALITALGIGWERVNTLKEVLTGDKSSTIIVVNALLAIIGIGAPVWFAWLSTKQIGTTFRLAEDYAFKASVAQAYEGYRIEATDIDEEMRTRLFSAALDRFEEAPIRLVDPSYHSSPLEEALSNPNMRSALNRVPDLASKLLALLPAKAGAVAAIAVPATVAAATLANDDDELEVAGREQ